MCLILQSGKFVTRSFNKYIQVLRCSSARRGFSQKSEMAQLISGVKIAAQIRGEVKKEIEEFINAGNRAPQLTCIVVGENPASETYIRNKTKACEDVGICSEVKRLPVETTESELLQLIAECNESPEIDGILIQMPLPAHIKETAIFDAVNPKKDVDGFNVINIGRTCTDMHAIVPCTPLGVQELLKRTGIKTFGKNAVVVGRSKNVGMPMAMLLHTDGRHDLKGMDATVTICHRFTPPEQLATYCKLADIIVVAAGVPSLIKGDMVKKGACVIDIGINRIKDETGKNKIVGDVDFNAVSKVAGHITPVPGGVGPMTVAMLLRNTLKVAKDIAKKESN